VENPNYFPDLPKGSWKSGSRGRRQRRTSPKDSTTCQSSPGNPGHEADVSAEHLTSSKWQSPRRPDPEANVGGDQHTPLPRLAQVLPERPVHEAKSMEWITTCWWPQQGTTEPATSATENEESPVLDGTTEPATSATENEESPDLDDDADAPGRRVPEHEADVHRREDLSK